MLHNTISNCITNKIIAASWGLRMQLNTKPHPPQYAGPVNEWRGEY